MHDVQLRGWWSAPISCRVQAVSPERFRYLPWLGAVAVLAVVMSAFLAAEVLEVPDANDPVVSLRASSSGLGATPPVGPTAGVKARVPLPPAIVALTAPQPAMAASGHRTPAGSSLPEHIDLTGEICGLGSASPGSAEAASLTALAAQRDSAAAAQLFDLMARSPAPAVRAAALFGSDQREALAMAAQHTRDPVIYAFARQACSRPGAQPAACGLLSAHRMAALDPQNVVPWLWVAEEANRLGDAHGVSEAVYRASLAKESRLREYAFTALAMSAIPADWPPWEAVFASAHVLQVHAALRLPSYVPMVQHCSAENTQDANVRQTCDRLAQVLIERGDTLVDHGIGRRIGERAGWTADRVQLLHARHAAYAKVAVDGDSLASGSGHGSCGQLVRNVQLALAHALHGERSYVQAKLAESGTTDAELLVQFLKGQAASAPR